MGALGPMLAGLLGLALVLGLSWRDARRRRRQDERLIRRIIGEPREASAQDVLPPPPRLRTRDLPRLPQLWLARADITLSSSHLLAGGVALGATGIAVLDLLGPVQAVLVVVAAPVLAALAVRHLGNRRLRVFVEGLPTYLESLRQLVAVGNSFGTAIVKANESAAPEMRRYLDPLVRRLQNGAPVAESITWLAGRIDVPELHMLATAVETNARYGGRMTLILSNLTNILRERARVERELRSATSELRAGGIVLSLLPIGAGTVLVFLNPEQMRFFIDEEIGRTLLWFAGGMQVTGMAIMRRLMRTDF